MAITVRALTELPHLALTLVAGAGGQENDVRWTHVAEVPDPTPWLEGGELILTTGLGMAEHRRDQVAYLRRLSAAGAVGVVVVRESAPALTPQALEAADALGFPLVVTSIKQPFRAIAEAVFAATASAQTQRLVEHLRIYGVLRSAAEGGRPEEVLERLASLSGMRLTVVREDGRRQFPAGGPEPRWSDAAAAFAQAPAALAPARYARLAAHESDAGAYVVQLDTAGPNPLFLIAEGLDVNAMPDLVAVHHVATVMSAQLLAQRAQRAVRQRIGAELLREVLGFDIDDRHAAARLRTLGMPPAVLVALVLRPPAEHAGPLGDRLHDWLLDEDMPALVGTYRSDLIVLASLRGDEEELGREASEVARSSLGSGCPIGVGTPGPVSHVATSYREALIAAAYAEATWSSGGDAATAASNAETAAPSIVAFRRLEAPLAWMPQEPERLALLVERTVGPLVAYDRGHHGELLRTLREYLRADRSPTLAARSLHLHRNTLAYRLRKIEALTGRSLRHIEDQVELWLGLRAYDLGPASFSGAAGADR